MRELAISIYLLGFKVLFTLFKLFPLKKKVTFLISFSDNSMYIYRELQRQKIDMEVVFLCNNRCFNEFKRINKSTYLVESKNLIHTIVGIYHIATSRQVIVDNYYGFLATINFKKDVKCTQIWHSAGAIKQFGAEDPTNVNRTPAALKRFKKVYDQFDQFAIGSDFMGDIFKKAFLVKEGIFLKTGIPRTDFFFDENKHSQIKKSLYKNNSLLEEKKVILYAPTFRRYEIDPENIRLDIKKMYEDLKGEYVLLIKLHPAIRLELDLSTEYQDFVFDYSNYADINELMIITDILITDYSSIPMEFVLLKRKMIFFAYDLEEYKKDTGLWEVYEASVPGPVVKNTDGIVDVILNHETDLTQLDAYAEKWTKYCDGNSSQRFVEEVFG
jgi:CDP-glycerol glycerophosphotransferase (TagB/SpsB family)